MGITISRVVSVVVMLAAIAAPVEAGQSPQGPTDEEIAALVTQAKADPSNPQIHYRLAVAYWYKACLPKNRDCEAVAGPADSQAMYVESGLSEVDKALAIRADYVDALAYKNLFLRGKALLEPSRADALIKEADALIEAIQAIRRR